MNKYRVDRASSRVVPAGMNSILYIGGNMRKARLVFDKANPGFDSEGRPNELYGVILSVWNEHTGEYTTKATKGLYTVHPTPDLT